MKWGWPSRSVTCRRALANGTRGQPLVSHEAMVNLIGTTRTEKGLFIRAELDAACYPKGLKITDQQMAQLQLQPAQFHGEWNYTIQPRLPKP